jgi:hypothetical protein
MQPGSEVATLVYARDRVSAATSTMVTSISIAALPYCFGAPVRASSVWATNRRDNGAWIQERQEKWLMSPRQCDVQWEGWR